jgi:hypothetical protein
MLHLDGELFVRRFGGRRGHFNIGKLVTPHGEFSVKDAAIDELDEGAYRGSFAVERLFLVNSQLPSGSIIVEMRARLASMSLDTDRPTTAAEPVGIEERDPIDEPETPTAAAQATPPEPAPAPPLHDRADADSHSPPAAATTTGNEEAALFAELWPLGEEVKLDPVVGRPLLRQQIDALKRRGYRYNAQRQVWRMGA